MPVTVLDAVVNSENLLVRMLFGALLPGKVPEFASNVLGIIPLMGIVFQRKNSFCSFSAAQCFSRWVLD